MTLATDAASPTMSDRSTSLLNRAVRHAPRFSKQAIQERLFVAWFNGLVYNQIWEDPDVDAAALQLGPHSRILTISSAGCNVLNYLVHRPASITAVDLNRHHLSVTRLKLACMEHLPSDEAMFRFWGEANDPRNVDAFMTHVAPRLDGTMREYWCGRRVGGRARIDAFASGFYRRSRLGRLLGVIHGSLRAIGRDPRRVLELRDDPAAVEAAFERMFGPLFENAALGWLSNSPLSVFNLGIPPEQFRAMRSESSSGTLLQEYRERVHRLLCRWSLNDNYFAWQTLARRYDTERRQAVPPYLKAEHRDVIREGLSRVQTHLVSTIDHLEQAEVGSHNAFIFLDSQDWMTPAMITRQWKQIARVGAPGSRIIFRTAAASSPIETSLPPELLTRFEYHAAESKEFHHQDRSAIYGGFHLYTLKA